MAAEPAPFGCTAVSTIPPTAISRMPPIRCAAGIAAPGRAIATPEARPISASDTKRLSPETPGVGSVANIVATIVAKAATPNERSAYGMVTDDTVRRALGGVIGSRVDPSPPVGGGAGSNPAPMTDAAAMRMLSGMTSTLVHTETAIEVSGVRRAYGPVQALDGVDLTVRRGELLALLGPNGAGKTTLVEILEGHRVADSGRVDVLGHAPARRQRAFLERIGIVLQEEGLDPNLNVGEAVALYSAAYPNPRPVDEVLDLVGLAGRAGDRAATMSGGQRRRLDLALGIAGDPEILFLDEPTPGFHPSPPPPRVGRDQRAARARQDD